LLSKRVKLTFVVDVECGIVTEGEMWCSGQQPILTHHPTKSQKGGLDVTPVSCGKRGWQFFAIFTDYCTISINSPHGVTRDTSGEFLNSPKVWRVRDINKNSPPEFMPWLL
jgi:hypothetical protein